MPARPQKPTCDRTLQVSIVRALSAAAILAVLTAAGCRDTAKTQPVKTQPAERPEAIAPQSQVEQPEAPPKPKPPASAPEQPAPPPETHPQPAHPVSTYSNKPPYPVSLFVRDPENPSEEQPGWLRIEQLDEEKQLATATGKFPEQNRIYVETSNVRRIRIHVGHLPLAANERIILQIDKQGMVLSRKEPFVTLNRLPTGEWTTVKQKK
jgi:hypothetical protein